MSSVSTLVIQSHRSPLPHPWLGDCLASVRDWAGGSGFAYRFLDDALFDPVPAELRHKCADRPMIAADLGRLYALSAALSEGFEAAVWCDADLFVFDPGALTLPDVSHAVGRELWVHPHRGRPRVHRQVHNAMLLARRGNPLLAFYLDAAQRIVAEHTGPMVPQLVGPKLLTALHNVVHLPVIEAAQVASPWVLADLRAGGGPYLDCFRRACTVPPAAVNLCASLVERGDLTDQQLHDSLRVIEHLGARRSDPARGGA
ncbi:MAG TPA: hypothetical protein ENK18_22310 [Deltaproteobacteria bacterium]|nr:hypothetical protein [Deltaproteobacteria bacterium]